MCNMSVHVCQISKLLRPACKCFIFGLVYMDCGSWKVAYPAAMIEMHVGQNDMLQIFRFIPQKG